MKNLLILFLVALPSQVFALGEPITVYEATATGGIWDHGDEFYILTELKGFGEISGTFKRQPDGKFLGEIVADEFKPNEKRYLAEVVELNPGGSARLFLLKMEGLIREFLLYKAERHRTP